MRHRTIATRWILPAAGAVLLGFGAGRAAAPAPQVHEVPPGEDEAAWKRRDAARTRLEIRLGDLVAAKDFGAARIEAEALVALDPFHAGARSLLREPIPDAAAAAKGSDATDGTNAGAAARSTNAYEEARKEVRRRTIEAIDGMYPHPGVAAAIRRWAWEGRLDQAIEELRKLRGDVPGVDGTLAGLRLVAARLEAGRLAQSDGRLSEADAILHQAFEAERTLLPEGVASVAVREARRQLAQGWFDEGRRFAGRDQLAEAESAWRRGLAADPSHLDLRAALQRAAER